MQSRMDSGLAGLSGCVGLVAFGLFVAALAAAARWLPKLMEVLR